VEIPEFNGELQNRASSIVHTPSDSTGRRNLPGGRREEGGTRQQTMQILSA